MDVQTIQMDPRIAAIHYKDYRKKVREHRRQRIEEAAKKILESGRALREARAARELLEKEDTALMASYREMAKGQRILNLSQVMRTAGVDTVSKSRLPVLAIAQADWPYVWFRIESGRAVFSAEGWPRWSSTYNKYGRGGLHLPMHVFPAELTNAEWRKQNNLPPAGRIRALVPAIPVSLRPAGDLSNYHILFEAKWTHEAPPDPLLLKRVSGDIYSVVAQWDLTPIEKAILEGRGS
jgi:hypothetical protein